MKKFLKKIRNAKGFTLAELLIVVAIIAVLVAIAIPIFTSQLERSRDAVTVSNLRSAYAQAQTAYLTQENDTANGVTFTKNGDGTATVKVEHVLSKGTVDGYGNTADDLPFTAPTEMGGTVGDYTVTFTYNANGGITDVAVGS